MARVVAHCHKGGAQRRPGGGRQVVLLLGHFGVPASRYPIIVVSCAEFYRPSSALSTKRSASNAGLHHAFAVSTSLTRPHRARASAAPVALRGTLHPGMLQDQSLRDFNEAIAGNATGRLHCLQANGSLGGDSRALRRCGTSVDRPTHVAWDLMVSRIAATASETRLPCLM